MNIKKYITGSVRNKGVALFSVPLFFIAIFILTYYPDKEKSSSLKNIDTQVQTLSRILAFTVGAGLHDSNLDLVQATFNWAKQDKNVTYISILDETNSPIIDYNPNKMTTDAAKHYSLVNEGNLIKHSEKINYKGKDFGKIILCYSLEKVNDNIAAGRNTSLMIVGLILILGSAWAVFVFNRIAKSVRSLRDAVKEASEGNLQVKIEKTSIDEIGDLSDSFKKMLENIHSSEIQLEEEKKSVEKRIELAIMESETREEYLSGNVKKLLKNMENFSAGDLTVMMEAEGEGDDEIGKLFNGFNDTVQKVRETLINVIEAVQATATASSEISSSTEEMAAGSQQQSVQAAEVACAVEEMTRTIMETTKNASSASENAKVATAEAATGVENVSEAKKGMERIITSAQSTGKIINALAQKSDQIGEIAQVIGDIADQTNLLALNAAIEAARAGEQGRGFAVVADEVRKLAERTTKATKEIALTIKSIQKEAKDADASMEEACQAVAFGQELNLTLEEILLKILNSTNSVAAEIEDVAAASEEQSSAAKQISENIESISCVTHETATGTQQVARAAEDLNRLTDELQNHVSQFTISNHNGNVTKNYQYEKLEDLSM